MMIDDHVKISELTDNLNYDFKHFKDHTFWINTKNEKHIRYLHNSTHSF